MFSSRLALPLTLLALASPAWAQDDEAPQSTRRPELPAEAPALPAPPPPVEAEPEPEPEDIPPPGPPPQVFISPAGEPFRAPPGQPYPVAAWFAGADKDGDGRLTRDEFVADALRFFGTLDADSNGVLDGFEIADYEAKVAPEILPRAARPQGLTALGGPPGGAPTVRRGQPRPYGLGRSGAGLYGLINEVQPVMAADTDIDRRVSRAEAEAAARDRFRILDEAGTGALTLEALPPTPMQRLLQDGPPRR